ncbi:hypothetical protein CLV56_3580 [Mumia flava]|uniref:Uncharacterized protein n=1 Tax=Mumia flava TaxID=1348852 RepID=A0A0B2BUD5_9ACTN|nr:hypothetical protein [Mumia flava]PJJ54076.1 hypothetical protein CLV56_3580 [Mumia flava]
MSDVGVWRSPSLRSDLVKVATPAAIMMCCAVLVVGGPFFPGRADLVLPIGVVVVVVATALRVRHWHTRFGGRELVSSVTALGMRDRTGKELASVTWTEVDYVAVILPNIGVFQLLDLLWGAPEFGWVYVRTRGRGSAEAWDLPIASKGSVDSVVGFLRHEAWQHGLTVNVLSQSELRRADSTSDSV